MPETVLASLLTLMTSRHSCWMLHWTRGSQFSLNSDMRSLQRWSQSHYCLMRGNSRKTQDRRCSWRFHVAHLKTITLSNISQTLLWKNNTRNNKILLECIKEVVKQTRGIVKPLSLNRVILCFNIGLCKCNSQKETSCYMVSSKQFHVL